VPFEKIELHRPSQGKDLIYPEDASVIAVASDEKIATANLPLLDLNKPQDIADYIYNWLEPE
jgi:molybdopterin-guanine dinucleotide biosynthesis protein B